MQTMFKLKKSPKNFFFKIISDKNKKSTNITMLHKTTSVFYVC